MKSIAIIGAGVTGVTTACILKQLGYQVTVFEKQRYASVMTSYANGGQLSASNAEVWNHFGTIFKAASWLFKKEAPLKMNYWPDGHKISWISEFLLQTRNYRKNTIATTRMAIESRKLMQKIIDDAGIDFDKSDCGILHIYNSQREFDHAHRVNALLAEGGLERRRLSGSEILEIEPSLTKKFVGGYYTKTDSTGDIHKFTSNLADVISTRGVEFKLWTDVKDIKTSTHEVEIVSQTHGLEERADRFNAVVICAGVASHKFGRKLGDRINIYPVKGYSITVPLSDSISQQKAPMISLLDDEAKIVTSRLGRDRFRVAGTAEIAGHNLDIVDARIKPLTRWVECNFPELPSKDIKPWAGLRPMRPNMIPLVAKGRKPNIFYNTGHGHLGWTLACYTANMVGELINAADA